MTLFQRLKRFTTDIAEIAAALKDSTELELDQDEQKVRRVTPLPEVVDTVPLTVVIEGLDNKFTIEQVEQFLSDNKVDFKCVRLRTQVVDGQRTFNGSVFVALGSEEDAKAVADRTDIINQQTEKPVKIVLKSTFEETIAAKNAEKVARQQQKEEKRLAEEKELEESLRKFQPTPFEAGHLLTITNLPETAKRENFLDIAKELGLAVSWIDYDRGRPSGAIKFDNNTEANPIATICQQFNDKASTINSENPPVFAVLEGEAEQNEWQMMELLKEEKLVVAQANPSKNGGKKRRAPFNKNRRDNNKRQRN